MERPDELHLEVVVDPGEPALVRDLAWAHVRCLEVGDDGARALGRHDDVDVDGRGDCDPGYVGERDLERRRADDHDIVPYGTERFGCLGE